MQALEHADESQKRILFVSAIDLVPFTNLKGTQSEPYMSDQQENYGKSNPESVAKVKDLYKELNLEVCLQHSLYLSFIIIIT